MHCLCHMCRRVLLVVLWLLIGTLSRLLVVGLLSIAEALCPSLCLFETILVALCLMVWDWLVSRAEPMLSCCHDLLFHFCLLLFYVFLPSMRWLCGVGVFGLIECPHSLPALLSVLQNNNNNNSMFSPVPQYYVCCPCRNTTYVVNCAGILRMMFPVP